jgi:molybdenum cofactor biosynthesis protein B
MKVHEQHREKGPEQLKIALIVVSSTCFKEMQESNVSKDETIPLIKNMLKELPNFILSQADIISDDAKQIRGILENHLADETLHAIIFSGGTGLSIKDITYETIQPLFEKEIAGFGEIFRFLSYNEIGSSAMLSRATAGKIKDKAVFLLPGSPKAVELAFTMLILPELKHMTYIINKRE